MRESRTEASNSDEKRIAHSTADKHHTIGFLPTNNNNSCGDCLTANDSSAAFASSPNDVYGGTNTLSLSYSVPSGSAYSLNSIEVTIEYELCGDLDGDGFLGDSCGLGDDCDGDIDEASGGSAKRLRSPHRGEASMNAFRSASGPSPNPTSRSPAGCSPTSHTRRWTRPTPPRRGGWSRLGSRRRTRHRSRYRAASPTAPSSCARTREPSSIRASLLHRCCARRPGS